MLKHTLVHVGDVLALVEVRLVGVLVTWCKVQTNESVMHCSILDSLRKCISKRTQYPLPSLIIFCFLYSEWVLGTREDLVKDIIAELRPELGEVITDSVTAISFDYVLFFLQFCYCREE